MKRKIWMLPAALILSAGLAVGIACDTDDDDNDVLPGTTPAIGQTPTFDTTPNGEQTPAFDSTPTGGATPAFDSTPDNDDDSGLTE